MKFFETRPYGVKTLTPDGELLMGIVLLAISAVLLVSGSVHHDVNPQKNILDLIVDLGMAVSGAAFAWRGYRRRKKAR